MVLRSKRVADVIAQHDEWLKDRRDYDIITATLDENWEEDAGYIYDAEWCRPIPRRRPKMVSASYDFA